MARTARVERNTNETRISVSVDLDGTGAYDVVTGIGFLDHMLEQLSRHSLIDLTVKADGDLHIDAHHTTEDSGYAVGSAVAQALGERRGEMTDMRPSGGGKTRLTFLAPSRGLIGYHGQFLNETRGTGVMSRLFNSYGAYRGPVPGRRNGVLISNCAGRSVPFALWNLEERGVLFIGGGTDVYEGMIIGEHSRGNDLEVNPLKSKKLTNMRASGSDEAVRLTTPRSLKLEEAISYIDDDELVEVTPRHVRLRKRLLSPHDRKKESRKAESA